MKVLIVDDNVMTRSLIKDLLTEMGHEVTGEAENGDEAVREFTSRRPDLVLLDLIMPGKNGLQVLEELKAIDPAPRVVMVTAVQQEVITRELMEKGAAGVLHKPFMYEELDALLKSLP